MTTDLGAHRDTSRCTHSLLFDRLATGRSFPVKAAEVSLYPESVGGW